MKPITVKTIYNGLIAFPEKFYSPEATVKVGNEYMSLKNKKQTGYSEWLDDKWGRGKYRLIYFLWQPDERQLSLLKGKAKKVARAWERYNKLSDKEKYLTTLSN